MQVWIPGLPRPQGSLKIVTSTSTGKPFAKNSQQLIEYRGLAVSIYSLQWVGQPPMSGPLLLECVFVLPRPKTHYGTGRNSGLIKKSAPAHPTSAPDLDKLVRTHGDALTIAGVIEDDAQIAQIRAVKTFQTNTLAVGALIRVSCL